MLDVSILLFTLFVVVLGFYLLFAVWFYVRLTRLGAFWQGW